MANKGPLTERCKALIAKRGDVFAIKCVQQPLKQLCSWVADLEENWLRMPPGRGKKFNGCCMLPPELVEELESALKQRGTIPASAPLLVTGNGCKIDARNIHDTFKRAVVLVCVKLNWPADVEPGVTPRLVALAIHKRKVGGFDGVPPVDEEKKLDRERIAKGIAELATALKPRVVAFLKDRLSRELRHTHIT